MSRDPFEHMRDRNPVPPADEPMAPAALAERIMGGSARTARRPMPGWAIATAAAAAVLAVGGVMMILTNPRTPVVGSGDTTTTAVAADTTTTSTPTETTIPAGNVMEARAYFFADLDDDWIQTGPFLIPIAVPLTDDIDEPSAIAHQALAALFRGTGLPDGVSSAIPEDAVYSGVNFDKPTGVITVLVSDEFVSGGGSFSMMGRLAQVIYTATAVDGVTGVRFLVGAGITVDGDTVSDTEGELTTVFGGEGIVIDDPATREGFDDFLPPVFIDSPAYGANVGNPLVATGKANTFEATLQIELTLLDGTVLWEGFTTATCGTGCWGDWQVEIPVDVDVPQEGILYAFTDSMEDGSRITIRSHRVWLTPDDATPVAECSGAEATTPLEDQDGLPAAVAEARAAIWTAAHTCDWATLTELAGDTLSWSFGGDPGDPTPYWQDLEAVEQPMRFLAELLTMSYGVIYSNDGVDGDPLTIYTWPAVHATGELDAESAARLAELFGDDQSTWFTDAGYLAYRIGIAEDGRWMFFIGGD